MARGVCSSRYLCASVHGAPAQHFCHGAPALHFCHGHVYTATRDERRVLLHVGAHRRCSPSVFAVGARRRCSPSVLAVGARRRCSPSVLAVSVRPTLIFLPRRVYTAGGDEGRVLLHGSAWQGRLRQHRHDTALANRARPRRSLAHFFLNKRGGGKRAAANGGGWDGIGSEGHRRQNSTTRHRC